MLYAHCPTNVDINEDMINLCENFVLSTYLAALSSQPTILIPIHCHLIKPLEPHFIDTASFRVASQRC